MFLKFFVTSFGNIINRIFFSTTHEKQKIENERVMTLSNAWASARHCPRRREFTGRNRSTAKHVNDTGWQVLVAGRWCFRASRTRTRTPAGRETRVLSARGTRAPLRLESSWQRGPPSIGSVNASRFITSSSPPTDSPTGRTTDWPSAVPAEGTLPIFVSGSSLCAFVAWQSVYLRSAARFSTRLRILKIELGREEAAGRKRERVLVLEASSRIFWIYLRFNCPR